MSSPRADAPAPRLAFRGDIEGLRAVAVLGVLVFHVFPDVLTGGFLGVDVFFVISGYLITRLVLQDLRAGTFSLGAFYRRRVRRIVPLAAVVLAITLAAGWWSMFPHEFQRLGEETAAAGLFGANVYAYFQAGYFAPEAHLRPQLHFWSLGVEEQFYLLFPLLLWAAAGRGRRLGFSLLVVGLASFGANVAWVIDAPNAAFFLLPARAWQFVAGGAAAAWHVGSAARPVGMAAHGLRGAGLLLIVGSFWTVQRWDPVPGVFALAPTLGAGLVVAAEPGAARSWLLDNRPLRHLGRLSFGLYLWHWPLLALLRTGDAAWTTPGPGRGAVVLGASWALAAASHRWVEAPARQKRGWGGRPVRALVVMAAVTGVSGLAAGGVWGPRLDGRFASMVAEARKEWPPLKPWRFELVRGVRLNTRPGGVEGRVVFVGDSFMEHYAPRLVQLMESQQQTVYSAAMVTYDGCLPLPGVMHKEHPSCLALYDVVDDLVAEGDVRRIVIGGRWNPGYDGHGFWRVVNGQRRELSDPVERAHALDALGARAEAWRAAGIEVVLVLASPYGDPLRLVGEMSLRWWPGAGGAVRAKEPVPVGPLTDPVGRAALVAWATAHGVRVIDPVAGLCTDVCPTATDEGWPVYIDAGHLRPGFAREHATFIDETLRPSPAPGAE